jgi:hypothetical protein
MVSTSNYELFSTQNNKNVSLVVKIAGIPDVFSSRPLSTRIYFGDPIKYGDPGLVYGGLRPYVNADGSTYRDYISLDGSSLSITQKLEPEAGRATVSNISIAFIDKGGYMTQILSPGLVIPEILGCAVEVFLGYAEISWPEDYVRVFRGFVSQADSQNGMVILTISDPNLKRRQKIFLKNPATKTTASCTSSATTISVPMSKLYTAIVQPDGSLFNDYTYYIKLDDEWIEGVWFSSTQFHANVRGARSTVAAAHASASEVTAAMELNGNPMTLALKLMLSGWGGPWNADSPEPILSIGPYPNTAPLVTTTNQIILPSKVDAVQDHALSVGDYVFVSGSGISGNNMGTGRQVLGFQDLDGQPNRVILVDNLTYPLYKEGPSSATITFRSQFDTLPLECGMKLTPRDVDVAQHLYLRDTFLGSSATNYTFLITDQEDSGKSFIEEQIYRPVGCYSLTRGGLLSVGINLPPIAGQTLVELNADNVLSPETIRPSRSTNARSFYNEIDFSYDIDDAGNYTSIYKVLDSGSLNLIGINSTLSIESRGLKTINNAQTYMDQIARNFLSRFKRGMVAMPVKVNWGVGSLIETGDTILLTDNGELQIPNFENGNRYLGAMLLQVVDRVIDIKSGNVQLKLAFGIQWNIKDRYATIAPSSKVISGSTSSAIKIQDSYGALFPGKEQEKWEHYLGEQLLVHSADFSVQGTCTLNGFDPVDPYKMLVTGLGFTPAAGYIVELDNYPTAVDPAQQQIAKLVHDFLSPSVSVVTGVSGTAFTVAAGDIGKFQVGLPVRVHNSTYTIDSGTGDILVSGVNTSTNTVTVDTALGFTPAAGQLVDLVGFADGAGPYRFV